MTAETKAAGPRLMEATGEVKLTRPYYDGAILHKAGSVMTIEAGDVIPASAKVLPPKKAPTPAEAVPPKK